MKRMYLKRRKSKKPYKYMYKEKRGRKSKAYVAARDRVNLTAGDIVQESLDLNGMTQKELSKKTGIWAPDISNMCTNKKFVSVKNAARLAKALKIKPYFILFNPNDTPRRNGQGK